MEFDLPKAIGIVALVIVLGTVGIVVGTPMLLQTTLMMVVPSMIAFGAIAFIVGMKHGEFRATRA